MRNWLVITALMVAQATEAACLNPFGCGPVLRSECVDQAKDARTAVAARAAIRECERLPVHSESECQLLTKEWASYLRSNAAREWNWPKLEAKSDCTLHYPATFQASAWVTLGYCRANEVRIRDGAADFDTIANKPRRLLAVRAKVPGMGELTDRSAVQLIQQVYYGGQNPEEIAAALFIDGPPDLLQVQQVCRGLAK